MKTIVYKGTKPKMPVVFNGKEYVFINGIPLENVPNGLADKVLFDVIPLGRKDKRHPRHVKDLNKYVSSEHNSKVEHDRKTDELYCLVPSKVFSEIGAKEEKSKKK